MATASQVAALRRAVNVVVRQAPLHLATEADGMRYAIASEEFADRLADALLDEGLSRTDGFDRGFARGYDEGYNAGLGVKDPTNPTSEEDTHNEL